MILSTLGKLQKNNPLTLVSQPLLNTCVGTALLLHRLLLYYFRSVVLVGVLVFCGLIEGVGQTTDDYRTRQSGNWNTLTTWERFNGTSWQTLTGTAPLTLPTSGDNNVTILNSHIITITANVTVDQVIINVGGQIIINDPRTLRIANGSGIDMNVSGTLETRSTAGSVVGNIGGIRIDAGASISFNSGSVYIHNVNGEGIPTATWNTNSNCNIRGITGTLPTSGLAQTFGNFTWDCAGQTSTITLPSITAKGNFTISNTNTQTLSGGANTFNIGGNWINNVTTINTGTSNVTFNGSTQQTIGGSSSTTFYNLILDNTNGAVLGNSETVNGTLTLTNGKLNLDVYNLSLGSAAVAGTLNASNMIVAEGAGQLRRTFTANGSYIFPVGDVTGNDEYSPVTVNVTGSAFSSAYIGVSLVDAKHPDNNSTTNYLTRYWNITQSGITGCVATITGTYINSTVDVSGTLGSIKAAQLNGTFNQASNPWIKTGGSVLSGTTLTYTGATITAGQTSAFTGITSADPTVSITGGNVTVCQNAGVTLTANPVGDAPFTYNWTGLITGTPTSTATATTSSVGGPNSYTVTVTDGNGFSSSTSSAVTVTVVAPPTISLNTSNESCPGSNDGSINTTLSGGLSNIRYIKLTQKYVNAEAYQQVQEIQAFEVFTGTNVALSSNGATASSSSTYQNDVPGYGPQLVNDGTPTGYFFWHSFSTNVGEWVKVDLGSAKNIDYLKIWNREDCCWSRGQNMLLELFDSGNNLVYSKSVNLWGGVDGPNSITENVVDLSWNDSGGTTLNRTGLSAGTYTLNYADAAGCSASEAATLTVTANLSSVAVAPNTAQAICATTSGTQLTATETGGGTITARQWGKRSNSGGAITAISGATGSTYTPTGADLGAGTWYVVCTSTPTCGSATVSNEVTVTVTANLSAVAVAPNTAQAICATTSGTQLTATETGGGTITARQWGKRLTSGGAITSISGETGSTFTPTGSSLGTGTWYIVCTSTPTCGSATVSNEVTVTIYPAYTAGAIANTGQTICSGTVPTTQIGITTAASGGDNTITYQWQYSTDNTFTTGVTTVASNTATYTPTQTLTQTTYYRRQAHDGTCNTSFTTSSGVWEVTVNPLPTVTLSDNQAEVCSGDMLTTIVYTATTGSPNQYSIDFDGAANTAGFSDVTNAALTGSPIEISVPANGAPDTYNAVLTVRNSTTGCISTNYDITIIIHPLPDTSEIQTN